MIQTGFYIVSPKCQLETQCRGSYLETGNCITATNTIGVYMPVTASL